MIRIVVDTNVLISGSFWSAASFEVLKLVDEKRVTLIVSSDILQEYDELLHRDEIINKFAYSYERAQAAAKILANAMLVEPLERVNGVVDDPDDNKFLEAAIVGNAIAIISRDNHLLRLKEFRGIKIISHEDFLQMIKTDGSLPS